MAENKFDFAGARFRALRTLFQGLAGSLSSIQIAEMATGKDIKSTAFVLILAIAGPVQAAVIAFFMNLAEDKQVAAVAEKAVESANVAAAEAAGLSVVEVVEETIPDDIVVPDEGPEHDAPADDAGPVIDE